MANLFFDCILKSFSWSSLLSHVSDKFSLVNKIKFFEHDVIDKNKLVKALKKKESNLVNEFECAKVCIKKLTIGVQKLDRLLI